MTEQPFDSLFERQLAGWLRELADEAVRPFDAVAIARQAAERAARPRFVFPTRPVWWRTALMLALLGAALVGVGIVGGFIRLPNTVVPNPSFEPFSPLPNASLSPAPVTPGPSVPASSAVPQTPPPGGPTPAPSASLPPATPSPTPSPSPSVGASASALPSPSSGPTVGPSPTATTPSPTASPVPLVSVATGDTHACALLEGGRVYCWGSNDEGQLGTGDNEDRDFGTVPVAGIEDARAVAAGIRFSCAVLGDGSVWCWGEDPGWGPSTSVPRKVPGISDAVDITAGGAFACALRSGGGILCWGLNSLGSLGNGNYDSSLDVPEPQAVLGIDDALQVSAGWNHACAVRSDRSLWCWGGNGDGVELYGPLGDGSSDLRRATPAALPGLEGVAEVQAGGWSTCARLQSGTVWCWGYGERGTLGDGNAQNSLVPVQVPGINDARLLALGDYTACVTRSFIDVWCWGDTSWGSPTGGPALTPVEGNKVEPLHISAIANDRYTLLIDEDGYLWWWGSGTNQAPERWPVGP